MVANTQPRYPEDVIHWRKKLISEVVPRVPTTQTPLKIGTAGDNGSIIHSIEVVHLGNNIATVVRVFSQPATQTSYDLELELTLPAVTTASEVAALDRVVFNLPLILPANGSNKALHLEAGESLYVALGTAIASGIFVYVRGGHY